MAHGDAEPRHELALQVAGPAAEIRVEVILRLLMLSLERSRCLPEAPRSRLIGPSGKSLLQGFASRLVRAHLERPKLPDKPHGVGLQLDICERLKIHRCFSLPGDLRIPTQTPAAPASYTFRFAP